MQTYLKWIDTSLCQRQLYEHILYLTQDIGERSIRYPNNLKRTAEYITDFYQSFDLTVDLESYNYKNLDVHNIITQIEGEAKDGKHFLLGAHYDSVSGSVGADDNASAIAVQLETARYLQKLQLIPNKVSFVSFALEEPPVFGTPYMGSKVHAKGLKKSKEEIDGMLCLEMIGYTCHQPGCQDYPITTKRLSKSIGDFIAVVGTGGSKYLSAEVAKAFRFNPNLPVLKINVPLKGYLFPPVRMSDHASFWDEGYKAVMITDSAFYRNPHYHKKTDTIDTLNFEFMAELTKGLVNFFSS